MFSVLVEQRPEANDFLNSKGSVVYKHGPEANGDMLSLLIYSGLVICFPLMIMALVCV